MKRELWSLILLLLLSSVCPHFASQTQTQLTNSGVPIETDLIDKKIDLEVKDATLLRVLSELGIDQDIPIGLELALSEKYEHRITLAVNRAPLEDVLNFIVQQEPDYQWEIKNGVVNFFPNRQRDAFIERLLATKVAKFAPSKGLTKFELRNAILDLPEVQTILGREGIVASRLDYPHRASIYAKAVDLSVSDTDVRGVLNKVIKESEHNMWLLRRFGRNNETLELGF